MLFPISFLAFFFICDYVFGINKFLNRINKERRERYAAKRAARKSAREAAGQNEIPIVLKALIFLVYASLLSSFLARVIVHFIG